MPVVRFHQNHFLSLASQESEASWQAHRSPDDAVRIVKPALLHTLPPELRDQIYLHALPMRSEPSCVDGKALAAVLEYPDAQEDFKNRHISDQIIVFKRLSDLQALSEVAPPVLWKSLTFVRLDISCNQPDRDTLLHPDAGSKALRVLKSLDNLTHVELVISLRTMRTARLEDSIERLYSLCMSTLVQHSLLPHLLTVEMYVPEFTSDEFVSAATSGPLLGFGAPDRVSGTRRWNASCLSRHNRLLAQALSRKFAGAPDYERNYQWV